MSDFTFYLAGRYGGSAPDATDSVSAQLAYISGKHQRWLES
jgi:hypothetical protein